MSYGTVETVREKVIGVNPCYEESGDITRLLLEEGQVLWDRRSVRSVIKALGRCYLVDLKEQARQLQATLQRSKLLPFYLSVDRVFIPVKVRTARLKNDACYAFIDWRYIADLSHRDDDTTAIKMSNGLEISTLSSTDHLIRQLHTGRQLYDSLQQKSGQNHSGEQLLLQAARLLVGSLDLIHSGLGKLGRNG